MPKYNTKQRTVLLEYLHRHADESLSAAEIADSLKEAGISISAVYRNLSLLESENKIHRVSRSDDRTVYYRFTGCEECRSHLHLSCSHCGRTFHMDLPSTKKLIETVEEGSDFEIDSADTVLYGLCGKCRKNG
ncbi:MAG: transcriptional repressor [Clostridia bacterium]|nr:transcriptional repressor [Clostridia bacterium]